MNILNDSASIIRVVNSYFPSELFKISVKIEPQISIFIKNNEDEKCLELIINKSVPNILLIKDLQKCNTKGDMTVGNGKYLLQSIEHIAYDLGMTEVMIDMDASLLYIKCNNKFYNFSLKNLYLFSSGNTWYGKYGYKLKYNSEEFLHNVNEFINQPFIDIKQKSFQSTIKQYFKPKETILIKDYFTNMLTDIQRLTHNKICINTEQDSTLENYHRVLQHYTNMFDRINFINYDGPYIKIIQRGGKKNKTRKYKNKKSKKSKKSKKYISK
jgi:hypothetical protein